MQAADQNRCSHAVDVHSASELCAIERQFSERGLSCAVKHEIELRERREAELREVEPLSYRLSLLPEGVINGRYRLGKEVMEADDLILYFSDTRALRTAHTDFSADAVSDECVLLGEGDKPCTLAVRSDNAPGLREQIKALPGRLRTLPGQTVKTVVTSWNQWFHFQPADTTQNSHRFPLSAFAAIAAVAMSLMLIVASSVMVHQGESTLNALTREIATVTGEVSDLRSDLSVKTDLLQVREVAVNEYGMVDEDFARTDYITMATGDSIEVFETKRENGIGLGALLSAIGLK